MSENDNLISKDIPKKEKHAIMLNQDLIVRGGIISPNIPRKETFIGIIRDWLYETLWHS